jgi:hypothetical protein
VVAVKFREGPKKPKYGACEGFSDSYFQASSAGDIECGEDLSTSGEPLLMKELHSEIEIYAPAERV